MLPQPFPLRLVLARTERVAVLVHSGRAYRNGFEFGLTLRRRELRLGPEGDPIHAWHAVRESGVIPDEALRLGIELSDGAKATVFDSPRFLAAPDQPGGPVLMQRGGSGGMHIWELGFWVWPLPPPGPLTFVAEWPSEDVALSRHEVDAAAIREAAARAEELWPDDA